MIKFFRHICKSLLSEGKTRKYFKYAIGEIFLVMIGILLALQVNNWNENRKDSQKEKAILIELKKDYLSNLAQLEEKMASRKNAIKSSLEILKSFDNPKNVIRDSLIKNIAIMANDPTFDPIQNDLISSGNIRLIRDEKLKRLLSNWSSDVIALTEVEAIWSKISNQELNNLLMELGIARDVVNSFENELNHTWILDENQQSTKVKIGNSKFSASVEELLNNKGLESMTALAINYASSANKQSEGLVNRIHEIIELTDRSIE